MNVLRIVATALVFSSLTSCNQEDASIEQPPGAPAAVAGDEIYLGMTESSAMDLAKERGQPARVIKRNGESLSTTEDYRTERVNFEIENGKVIRATRG
ncbi:MAG: hypothetical protein AAF236_01095 [Verrucomicrobiota bacterium]